jgi:hypothetical protein
MGGLDLANPVVGKYIITYTYTADTSITYSVTVWVWEKDHSFYATQDSPDNGWLIFEGEFTHEAGGQFVDGEEITVTAVAKEGYVFLGWYLVIDHETHAEYELISPDYSYTFILNKDVKLEAKFGAPVTEITLGDAAPITVYQGERVDLSRIGVWSHSIIESRNLNADEYTVDLGGLDLDNPIAGVYTVTFTYNENPDLKATLTVTVLKQSYYIEVGGVGDLFAYNGKTTDYLLEYLEEGTEIRLHADMAPILEKLGQPKKYTESASCAFEGLDKTYTYDSFVIQTYPQGDKDYVYCFWFVDDFAQTNEGIKIGDSQDKVETAYGAESFNGSNAYTLTKGDGVFTVIIKDGVVSSIQYAVSIG